MVMHQQVDVEEMELQTVAVVVQVVLEIHLEQELNQVNGEQDHHLLELVGVVQEEQEVKQSMAAEVDSELLEGMDPQVPVANQDKVETLQVIHTFRILPEVQEVPVVVETMVEHHVHQEEGEVAEVPY